MPDNKKYVSDYPELLAEWDNERNVGLNPSDVTAGSHKIIWWRCKNKHSWKAMVKNRTKGIGCPYCSGRYVSSGVNDLATVYPELAVEWDYTKNGDLKPTDVSCGNGRKVWWICKQHGHSWQAIIGNRTLHNQGCPYCAGKRVIEGLTDISTTDPAIATEWDYEKNGELKPTQVSRSSNKKVWWKCSCGHSWQAIIANRTKGIGCPYCSGKQAITGVNDLATTHPELVKEWDFSKNGDLLPSNVTFGSGKKAWWKCFICGYEWQAVISSRAGSAKCGCPLCSNQTVVPGVNDLATSFPELLEEWDYQKNKGVSPDQVCSGTAKKVWWKCKKCGRSWKAEIRNRSQKGIGCAVCSGKACGTGVNDLATLYPWLVEEFDEKKNGFAATEVAAHTATIVWWKCSICGKSWRAAISNRTGFNRTGCPHCDREKKTSFPEQAVFYYIKKFFPDAINGYKLQSGRELDIFIPSINFAVEYDGNLWHTANGRDDLKNEECIEAGIKLIRIREAGLPKLNTSCICYDVGTNNIADLEKAIIGLLSYELNIHIEEINIDIQRDSLLIQSQYRTLKRSKALSVLFPEISEEWCFEKNGELTPDKVTAGSGAKVWWKCKTCGYEWRTSIGHRTSGGTGCPKCKKQIAHKKYMQQMLENSPSLQDAFPHLASEWNSEKNGSLTPENVAAKSSQKAWWICSVCGYEWEAIISNRTRLGAGCPRCANFKSRKQKKCRKILCIETQTIYDSIAEIERQIGINHTCIIACCKGKHQTAGGFHWKYADEDACFS